MRDLDRSGCGWEWTKGSHAARFEAMVYVELDRRRRMIEHKGGFDSTNPYHVALQEELAKRDGNAAGTS